MMGYFPPRARWILLIVVLIELALFVQSHRRGAPGTSSGEGLVIWGDGLGYYAWLRSPLVDQDFSFANEFDEHNPLGHWVPPPDAQTELGNRANPFSVGPACCWSVTVVPGHWLVGWLNSIGLSWPADGYSLPYQLLVGGTTLLFSVAGLFFLYGICRYYARPERAALAAALCTLGTTIVYYNAVDVSMGHGIGTAVLAALVWYWLKSYGTDRLGRWLLLGALVGAAALVRWQLATFFVLPVGEALLTCWFNWKSASLRLCLAGLGACVAFIPQAIAWQIVYGHWLVSPMPLAHHWLQPALWEVLGSQNRSLFYWTPLTLLAFLGFLAYFANWRAQAQPSSQSEIPQVSTPLVGISAYYIGAGERRGSSPPCHTAGMNPAARYIKLRSALALLLVAFLLQVYALASVQGAGVYLGAAFGCRQLTEAVVVLAPGLALLLERASGRWFVFLQILGCALVLWNLLLVWQYLSRLLPPDAGAAPGQMLANLLHLPYYRPMLLLTELTGVFALTFLPVARTSSARRRSGCASIRCCEGH
jgi:hypothetical protein